MGWHDVADMRRRLIRIVDPTDPNALTNIEASAGIVLVPIAMGIAILRYRLYDIDRVISRSIAYGLVVGLLATTFATMILVLQTTFATITQGQTIAVAASSLMVDALFQPVRGRIRRIVDRLFDRARYDADLTATVGGSLAPITLGVWLRRAERAD